MTISEFGNPFFLMNNVQNQNGKVLEEMLANSNSDAIKATLQPLEKFLTIPLLLVWHEYNRIFIVLHRPHSRLLVLFQRYFSVVIKLRVAYFKAVMLHRFLHR